MKSLASNVDVQEELPFKVEVSFAGIYNYYKERNLAKDHLYYSWSKQMFAYADEFPELINGFSDRKLMEKHKEIIHFFLKPLFPDVLGLNEIKAASIPFDFSLFKLSERFENIIDSAENSNNLQIQNFDQSNLYVLVCMIILEQYYGYDTNFKRPLYLDVTNAENGIVKRYKLAINGEFSIITKAEGTPEITEDDFRELVDNYDDMALWKEKFPKGGYTIKGFSLVNLVDVTADEVVSSLKAALLKNDVNIIENIERNLKVLFQTKDLRLGISKINYHSGKDLTRFRGEKSILFDEGQICLEKHMCSAILSNVFENKEILAISDVEKYGKTQSYDAFYTQMKKANVQSAILLPIKSVEKHFVMLELVSSTPLTFHSINLNKLKDIIPVIEVAAKRISEEEQNVYDSFIQEYYTSIHPSVRWRFYEAAEHFYAQKRNVDNKNRLDQKVDDIVFNNIYPLYGQLDIVGSSLARNTAVKEDLECQLVLALDVLDNAYENIKLPIFQDLMYRIKENTFKLKGDLRAGDEVEILNFMKKEIYPVFTHLKKTNKKLSVEVSNYFEAIDSDLHVVYDKRRKYEESVFILNDILSKYIDEKQKEAQQMFPHYFERYNTDGLEYNMYIGAEITKSKPFDRLYLYNLRLWQLLCMCEMEIKVQEARKNMTHDLQVASLILVHSAPLAIRFKLDEKQFDVDGAYNIRYEIIKKRIDKAYIKNTKNRLTVPGKIAIVYSQSSEAKEYKMYLKYLQSKNYISEVDEVEIEDLQGVTGLKALRASVIYNRKDIGESRPTLEDFLTTI